MFNDDFIDSLHRAEDDRGGALRDDAAPGRVRHVLLGLIAGFLPAADRGRPSPEPQGSGVFPRRPAARKIFRTAAEHASRRCVIWHHRSILPPRAGSLQAPAREPFSLPRQRPGPAPHAADECAASADPPAGLRRHLAEPIRAPVYKPRPSWGSMAGDAVPSRSHSGRFPWPNAPKPHPRPALPRGPRRLHRATPPARSASARSRGLQHPGRRPDLAEADAEGAREPTASSTAAARASTRPGSCRPSSSPTSSGRDRDGELVAEPDGMGRRGARARPEDRRHHAAQAAARACRCRASATAR